MSLPAIAQVILETVIGHLAVLFLSGAAGNTDGAREAARQMLAAYNAETPEELSLAAEIISLQFHALQALSDAAAPDLSMNRIIRLRGSAVSLSRESHKAQRKLDQLQRTRRAGIAEPAPIEKAQARPAIEAAPQTYTSHPTVANPTIADKASGETPSQSVPKQYKANRLAAKQQKLLERQARQAAQLARANLAAGATPQQAAA
jgi:hypothetical protein